MISETNISKEEISLLKKEATRIRILVLDMIRRSKSSHIGSNLSAVEILITLYFKVMNVSPLLASSPERDRFILSKGHAAAVLYAVLARKGFFKERYLTTYYRNKSKLAGHISYGSVKGVEISSGSLGHGLPIANGMAIAGKKDSKKYKVFALLSDGECEEGSTWEAILFAGQHKLDNLVAIVDFNKWQALGRVDEVLSLKPFKKKVASFGWEVREADGHSFKELYRLLSSIPFKKNKPSLLIAHTIKGKGLFFMENKLESHYKPPSDEEYKKTIENLKKLL